MTGAVPGEVAALTVDGRRVALLPGDTLAAALMRDGSFAFRRSRKGEARGVFCGIGICNECLLTVDGRPNVRACVTAATSGAIVTTGGGAP